jgi:predicted dehydrogenase
MIGYGGMGSWHVKNIREKIDEIKIKGAWDIRKECRNKAKDDGLYAYRDLQELLDDKEVNLVTVATPNNFHHDLVVACLESGKNVICEKPVAMKVVELQDMIDTAERCGKLFSIHQNRRWDKDYCIIRKILSGGIIGTPYFIESRVQGSRGAMHGWRGYLENGGGMVLDWGVHLIDQMLNMVSSPVTSVDAHLFKVFTGEVEDNIKIFLRFSNSVSVLLEMSTNCFVRLPRWHVSCSEGTVVVENWECEGNIVKLKAGSQTEWSDEIIYTAAGPTRTMAPRPEYAQQKIELPEVNTDWSEYYKNISDVLDGKTELIVKPEQAMRVMKVIELVFESQKVGHGLSCSI